MSKEPDYNISLKEVARRLGVSIRTVYRMIRGGQLPEPTKVRARSMIDARVVERIRSHGTA